MAKSEGAPITIDQMLDKGDGILVRRGHVWTYPNAETDRSGTNLKLPVESVGDAIVQEAIKSGDLVPLVTDATGGIVSVTRKPAEGETVRVVNMAQAGTVELGTEVPLNSRPTHDAGRRPGEVDPAIAQGKVAPKAPKPSGPIAPAAPIAAAAVPAVPPAGKPAV